MNVKYYISDEQEKITLKPSDVELVKEAVVATLKYERRRKDREISITFVDNEAIRQINKEYRNIDRETDVLSFPLDEKGRDTVLGDVVISLEKAKSQSVEYGHSFERELAFLCVHSVLHLLGYDHEISKEDEKIMFEKQEKILEKMGQVR